MAGRPQRVDCEKPTENVYQIAESAVLFQITQVSQVSSFISKCNLKYLNVFSLEKTYPDANHGCLYIYLNDWVILFGQMLVNIPYMEHMGYLKCTHFNSEHTPYLIITNQSTTRVHQLVHPAPPFNSIYHVFCRIYKS